MFDAAASLTKERYFAFPSLSPVALQLPEGLQMFACVIADIIER